MLPIVSQFENHISVLLLLTARGINLWRFSSPEINTPKANEEILLPFFLRENQTDASFITGLQKPFLQHSKKRFINGFVADITFAFKGESLQGG